MSSRKLKYTYGTLFLNDGTHDIAENHFLEVSPCYAGDFKYSAQTTDHHGWLLCDGRSVIREEYPVLFQAIGTSFGSDDSETFYLPDCRGRILGVVGTGSGLSPRTLGDVVGSETTILTVNELPSHTHSGTTATGGSHTHTSNANGGQGGLGLATANGINTVTEVDSSTGELNVWTTPVALTIDASGVHSHTFTTGSTGLGNAFSIMPPTVFASNVFIFSR
jgi:microcystin-dependent protein